MHIVVIDPKNGEIEWARVFDTHESSEEFEEFCGKIQQGHIVVAACKEDCQKNMSNGIKNFFAYMGSTQIWNLKYQSLFAFIGIIGVKEPNEAI